MGCGDGGVDGWKRRDRVGVVVSVDARNGQLELEAYR